MSETPPPFAEYPRPQGPGGFGYSSRGPGVYFDAIGEAWNVVRADLGTWVAATIVAGVIYYASVLPINLILGPKSQEMSGTDLPKVFGLVGLEMVLGLIPYILYSFMHTGMIALGVRKLRGEYVNIGMIFEPFKDFGPMLGTIVLQWVILIAASLACIIPVFFFGPVLTLMTTVAFLQKVGPMEALNRTFDACKRYWLGLLGLLFITGILAGLGFCACLVGALITIPIYIVVLSIHYRAFFESNWSSTEPARSPYV